MLWGVCHRTLVGPGAHRIYKLCQDFRPFAAVMQDVEPELCKWEWSLPQWSFDVLHWSVYQTKASTKRSLRWWRYKLSAWVSLSASQHQVVVCLGYFHFTSFYWFKVLVTLTKVFPADSWRRTESFNGKMTWPHRRGPESVVWIPPSRGPCNSTQPKSPIAHRWCWLASYARRSYLHDWYTI